MIYFTNADINVIYETNLTNIANGETQLVEALVLKIKRVTNIYYQIFNFSWHREDAN